MHPRKTSEGRWDVIVAACFAVGALLLMIADFALLAQIE